MIHKNGINSPQSINGTSKLPPYMVISGCAAISKQRVQGNSSDRRVTIWYALTWIIMLNILHPQHVTMAMLTCDHDDGCLFYLSNKMFSFGAISCRKGRGCRCLSKAVSGGLYSTLQQVPLFISLNAKPIACITAKCWYTTFIERAEKKDSTFEY